MDIKHPKCWHEQTILNFQLEGYDSLWSGSSYIRLFFLNRRSGLSSVLKNIHILAYIRELIIKQDM